MRPFRPAPAALPLLLCALLTSCTSLAIPDTPSTTGTGNWYISGQSETSSSNISPIYIGGSLVTTGGQITGVFHINTACFGNYATDVPYTGTLDSNNHLSITSYSVNSQILTLHGTLSSKASTLSAVTFYITGGCTGNLTSLTGSDGPGATYDPTAERLPALSAAWTTTTGSTGPNLSEQLMQSPAAGTNGDYALTGTVMVTGSPCFTTGTLQFTSFVSGYLGQQTILMNDGSTLTATMQVDPVVDGNLKTGLQFGLAGTITGGNCNGPVDINLQQPQP